MVIILISFSRFLWLRLLLFVPGQDFIGFLCWNFFWCGLVELVRGRSETIIRCNSPRTWGFQQTANYSSSASGRCGNYHTSKSICQFLQEKYGFFFWRPASNFVLDHNNDSVDYSYSKLPTFETGLNWGDFGVLDEFLTPSFCKCFLHESDS